MNYTAIGFLAVLIWGISLPISRLIQDQIGTIAYLGILFSFTGTLSLARQKFSCAFSFSKKTHPAFYLRWVCFVIHEIFIFISVGMVSQANIPIIILINYLWPTMIILCSILLGNIRVYKHLLFTLGTAIVLTGLSYELLDNKAKTSIFLNTKDNIAYALTFLGAISWGLYCALSRRYGEVTGETRTIPIFQLTLGLALPLMFFPPLSHPWNLNLVGAIALCSICLAQTLAYYAWDVGMRLGNIVILSLFADFIPWLSLLGTAWILHIKIEKHTLFSAVLLVIGAIITRFATKAPKTTPPITL